jgi:hypothetical protein
MLLLGSPVLDYSLVDCLPFYILYQVLVVAPRMVKPCHKFPSNIKTFKNSVSVTGSWYRAKSAYSPPMEFLSWLLHSICWIIREGKQLFLFGYIFLKCRKPFFEQATRRGTFTKKQSKQWLPYAYAQFEEFSLSKKMEEATDQTVPNQDGKDFLGLIPNLRAKLMECWDPNILCS